MVATDAFVLVYSQLEQIRTNCFHVQKNGLLNGLLDRLISCDIKINECPHGEIGRHKGLKILARLGSASSSLAEGTTDI